MRRLMPIIASVLWLLVVCGPAHAEAEPNDTILDAQGPVLSAGPWSGTIAAGGDTDMYLLYVSGPAQLDIDFTMTSGSCGLATLRTADFGYPAASLQASVGQSGHLTTDTLTGTSSWLLQIDGDGVKCAGDYQFAVTVVGGALVGGPAFTPSTMVSALADDEDTGFGPLVSDINYGGVLKGDDDENWLYFTTAPGVHEIDVQVASAGCDLWWSIEDHDPSSAEDNVDNHLVWANTVDELTFSSPAKSTRYDIDLSNSCVPLTWTVRVSAPGALLSPPLSPTQQGGAGNSSATGQGNTPVGTGGDTSCDRARHVLATAKRRLETARHALLIGRTQAIRHAAARRLRAARRSYRIARRRVRIRC